MGSTLSHATPRLRFLHAEQRIRAQAGSRSSTRRRGDGSRGLLRALVAVRARERRPRARRTCAWPNQVGRYRKSVSAGVNTFRIEVELGLNVSTSSKESTRRARPVAGALRCLVWILVTPIPNSWG